MISGLIVAAGKSERMGRDVDKAFVNLGTKPVLAYSLLAFEKCPDIDSVVLVVRKDRIDGARGMAHMFGCAKVKRIIAGGAKRQTSVCNGLAQLSEDVNIVSVHDGARPCVTPELISATIKAAKRNGSGVAGFRLTDTVKYVKTGMTTVSKTMDRSTLWAVQTPQTFRVDLLKKAFAAVARKKVTVTDEASAVELTGKSVRLVPGPFWNMKITTANDLALTAALLKVPRNVLI